jgi:hypothetical protein
MQTVSINCDIGPRVNGLHQTAQVPCFHPMYGYIQPKMNKSSSVVLVPVVPCTRGAGHGLQFCSACHKWNTCRLGPCMDVPGCEPTRDAAPACRLFTAMPCHATLFYQLFYRDSNPYLNAEQAELYSTHKFPLGAIWNKFVQEANTVWFVLWKNCKGQLTMVR